MYRLGLDVSHLVGGCVGTYGFDGPIDLSRTVALVSAAGVAGCGATFAAKANVLVEEALGLSKEAIEVCQHSKTRFKGPITT